MSNFNWRLGGKRSANMVVANPQRLESPDGSRWATGRTVKRSLGDGVFDGVEVWTLKQRVDGKAVTVDTGLGREEAEKWVTA